MYFPATLIISSILAATHSTPHSTPPPTPPEPTLSPEAHPTKTITVTITLPLHLPPATKDIKIPDPTIPPSAVPPPAAPSSSAAAPLTWPEIADPTLLCAESDSDSGSGCGNCDVDTSAQRSGAGGVWPGVTASSAASNARMPMFTLDTAGVGESVVVGSSSAETESWSMMRTRSGLPVSSGADIGVLALSGGGEVEVGGGFGWTAITPAAPGTPATPAISTSTPSSITTLTLQNITQSITDNLDPATNKEYEDENEDKDENEDEDENTAWAGTDNAILSQNTPRSWPQPPPLLSYKPRSLRRPWRSISATARGAFRALKQRGRFSDAEMGGDEEKGECRICGQEDEVVCRGDVAVGVCKDGCVEVRFLGRGWRCEDGDED